LFSASVQLRRSRHVGGDGPHRPGAVCHCSRNIDIAASRSANPSASRRRSSRAGSQWKDGTDGDPEREILFLKGDTVFDGEKIEEFLGRFASRRKERVWPSWHKEVVDGRLAQTSIAVTGASQSMWRFEQPIRAHHADRQTPPLSPAVARPWDV